jgi:hypothetical protein
MEWRVISVSYTTINQGDVKLCDKNMRDITEVFGDRTPSQMLCSQQLVQILR